MIHRNVLLRFVFFFSSRRRHTRCALVTGVQTCALPILMASGLMPLPSRDRVDVAPACRRALARRRRVAARPHRIGPLLRNLATARRYAALDEHGEGY